MTYRSEESSEGEYSKAMWEAAAIAVGDGTCCSEYKLIKFRLTFLRVRFPVWSPEDTAAVENVSLQVVLYHLIAL